MSGSAHKAVALGLLRIAPADRPFSGRADGPAMPFLADVRGALDNIELRDLIVELLVASLTDYFPDADIIAGLSRAGVPWAAIMADRSRMPAAVINPEARASGLERRIEGKVTGQRVVLVDNLIDTGGSLGDATSAVIAAGGDVVGALTIITASTTPNSNNPLAFAVQSLWSMSDLAEAAFDIGHIDGDTHQRLISMENNR